jgi:hypothetical protein
MSDNGKITEAGAQNRSIASEVPSIGAVVPVVKDEKKATTTNNSTGLHDPKSLLPMKPPTQVALNSDLPVSQKISAHGGNAASPVPNWPTSAAKAAAKAIADRSSLPIRLAFGQTEGPVSSVTAKPVPMGQFGGVDSQEKIPQTQVNAVGAKPQKPQDLPNPFAGTPTIAARKKFALPAASKEVRVATTQAVSFGSTFVIIHAGKEENFQTFAIHENILSARSQQFKDHLSGLVSERGFKVINLPDMDPQAFSLYVQLLYTGHIPSGSPTIKTVEEYDPLCKLYVLVRKFDDVASQNAALAVILSKATEPFASAEVTLPRREHVGIIYSGAEGPCAGKRLMVDLYTSQATGEQLQDEFPAEFMGELAVSLMGVRKEGVGVVKRKEEYHEAVKAE